MSNIIKSTQVSQKSIDASWLLASNGVDIPQGVIQDICIMSDEPEDLFVTSFICVDNTLTLKLGVKRADKYVDVLGLTTSEQGVTKTMNSLRRSWRGEVLLGWRTKSNFDPLIATADGLPQIMPTLIHLDDSDTIYNATIPRTVTLTIRKDGEVVEMFRTSSGTINVTTDSTLCINDGLVDISTDMLVDRDGVTYIKSDTDTLVTGPAVITSINGVVADPTGGISITIAVAGTTLTTSVKRSDRLPTVFELTEVSDINSSKLPEPINLLYDVLKLNQSYTYRPTDDFFDSEGEPFSAKDFVAIGDLILDERFDVVQDDAVEDGGNDEDIETQQYNNN